MDAERIQQVYDRHAPTYDRSVGLVEKVALGGFRQAFGRELRGDTLEIAIGSGLNLPYYTPAVTRAVGADLSAGMLAVARRRAKSLGCPVELAQMNAEQLAFADQSFDTVAISLALCTVRRPQAALAEIARVCKPDGKAVFLEHVRSPSWPVAAVQRVLSPFQERAMGCSLLRDTAHAIEEAGFRLSSDRSRAFGVFRLLVASPPALPQLIENPRQGVDN